MNENERVLMSRRLAKKFTQKIIGFGHQLIHQCPLWSVPGTAVNQSKRLQTVK